MEGTVLQFDNATGYGFIEAKDETKDDIFVHYTQIQMDGFRTLKRGQLVEFKVERRPKGLFATDVVPLKEGVARG